MKISILLIDDDRDFLDTYEKLLTRRGYEVYTAISIEEGKRAMISKKPNIIILDLHFNNETENGFDLVKYIRRNPLHVGIEILMLTGDSSNDIIKTAVDVGCNSILIKPIDWEVLNSKIVQLSARVISKRKANRIEKYPPKTLLLQ